MSAAPFPGIDRATYMEALERLQLDEESLLELDAAAFDRVFIQWYARQLSEWLARETARIDQLKAARASIQDLPEGMPLLEAAHRGLVSVDVCLSATATVARIETEGRLDPNPQSDAVDAVLRALIEAFGVSVDE